MRIKSNLQNNPLRKTYFQDFSGACNDAVRPCNAQFMADLADINATAPGSARESKCQTLTAKMAKCLGAHGWPCKQVGKDSVIFDTTGDTMDLIANSGSGNAQFQCLLRAGPNFQPPESDGDGGSGNYPFPTQEYGIASWLSNNWYIPVIGIAVLGFVFYMMKKSG